ncbi:MAG: heme exporter protein CcmB [Chloroflexota bacterium]
MAKAPFVVPSEARNPYSVVTDSSLDAQNDKGGGARYDKGAEPRFFTQLGALLWKDLVSEWRRREVVLSLVVFSLLVLLVFDFAFDLRRADLPAAAPGILWVTFIFAGVLSFTRAFAVEKDRGTWEGLLLAPVDRGAIYLAKLLACLLFMLVVEAVTLAAFGVFFDVPFDVASVALVALAGTLGFATVGTLFAAMSANTRAREIFLPVLLFPVAVPVIIGSVKATALAFGGAGDGYPWLGLVLAFDAIFLAVSFAVFEFVIED